MPHSHHSHSGQFCRHAKDQLEDIVKEAIRQKFQVYGLTEHAPRYRPQDLYPEESDLTIADLENTYHEFLRTASSLKKKYADQIQLLIGLESDYITNLDLDRTLSLISSQEEIDYIVGSVHHVCGIPIDFDTATWLRAVYAAGRGEEGSMMSLNSNGTPIHYPTDTNIPQLQPSYTPSSAELRPFILAYLDQQLHMIRTLHPEVVGHFDLFRLYTPGLDVRSPDLNPEDDRGVWESIERNVKEVVGYGGLFEMNTAAFRKGWDTAYPCRQIAVLIIASGGKFCFSDDSHGVAQVGLNYHRLREYAASLGLESVAYLASGRGVGTKVEERTRRTEIKIADDIWNDHPFWESHK